MDRESSLQAVREDSYIDLAIIQGRRVRKANSTVEGTVPQAKETYWDLLSALQPINRDKRRRRQCNSPIVSTGADAAYKRTMRTGSRSKLFRTKIKHGRWLQ